MPSRINEAIVSTVWAIIPEALEGIIAVLERDFSNPAYIRMKEKAVEAGRWPPNPEALAIPGAKRAEGIPGAFQRENVAFIPVMGPIIPHSSFFSEVSGVTSVDSIGAALRAAERNPDVAAIGMVHDSPGGAVPGIHELAGKISSAKKPVEAFVYGSSASASYWLATGARSITTSRTGILGSIGVAAVARVQQGNDINGDRRVEIVSTNAPNKRPDLTTEAGAATLRAVLDEIESVFVGDVAKNMKVTREKVIADFGRGGLLVGQKAVDAGMAHGVSTFEAWADDLVARHAKPQPAPRRVDAANAFLAKRPAG